MVLEGQLAADHREQHYSAAPDVDGHPVVVFAGDHLGRGLAWAPTGSLQQLALRISVGQPEVDELEVLVVVEQQVLRLEVAVDHAE